MNTFRTKHYLIEHSIFSNTQLRFAFLTDLHGICYGEHNEKLIAAIEKAHPDMLLLAGDMLNRRQIETYQLAEELLTILVKKYPVYYALGNHEYKRLLAEETEYLRYQNSLAEAGIHFLHNEKMIIKKAQTRVCIHGLELPLEYYEKPFPKKLKLDDLYSLLGKPEKDVYNILLAHNPMFGKQYFRWGADLILSGHYHGGLVRFSENIGLVSSFGHPFARYCCGMFTQHQQHMLVSAGLGEHSIPIRIHNPRELLIVTCKSKE